MISLTKDNRMLGYELLAAYPDIYAFVTTRKGGCSESAYASFNCSPYCGDSHETVMLNQAKLLEVLPQPVDLIIPWQVHGTKITWIDHEFSQLSETEQQKQLHGVDALITNISGYCICVSTADCVPVLLYDFKHHVVAAIHAGWRGTVAHILGKTIQQMSERMGTSCKDLVAVIGPSISLESFEVGQEVYDEFKEKGFPMDRISRWNRRTNKHHIDLWEANRLQLYAFGVSDAQIACAGVCTYIAHEDFFSARRGGIASGRILSGIMMKKEI